MLLNADVKTRDEILFGNYDPNAYKGHGNIRNFEDVTTEKIAKLFNLQFIDPYDCQDPGVSPTAAEFYEFMKKHPGCTAKGYTVSADRKDYRVTITSLKKDGQCSTQEIADFANAFHNAEEFYVGTDKLYCWYN